MCRASCRGLPNKWKARSQTAVKHLCYQGCENLFTPGGIHSQVRRSGLAGSQAAPARAGPVPWFRRQQEVSDLSGAGLGRATALDKQRKQQSSCRLSGRQGHCTLGDFKCVATESAGSRQLRDTRAGAKAARGQPSRGAGERPQQGSADSGVTRSGRPGEQANALFRKGPPGALQRRQRCPPLSKPRHETRTGLKAGGNAHGGNRSREVGGQGLLSSCF